MKRVLLFIIVSALLAVFMSSCNAEPEEDKALENVIVEDEVLEEENLQNKYNIIYTPSDKAPSVSPEELKVFYDEKTHRYGYETENGKIIIPAIFRASTIFFEGLAAVCREWDGPLEYIDASGKTILTVEGIEGSMAIDYYGFQPPCIFNDGVAVIYDGGFCIDKYGNRLNIENPEGMYKCGLIAVRDPETNLRGYADIDGNIVIPYKYYWARDFEPQGVALVFSEETAIIPPGIQSNLRGYINTKGEEIIPLEYYDDPGFSTNYIHPIHRDVDGMIELYKDGYYYYFTYDGTLVEKVADEYSTETDEIVEETELVMFNGIPKELYDTYGESIINPEEDDYSYIQINFDESKQVSGYYEIEDGVIIDSNGKVHSEIDDESLLEIPGSRYPYIPNPEGVDFIYDSPYNSNLLIFSKDGRYGYLNTDGEIVIEAQFYAVRGFSEGLAAVCREIGGPLEYINESGETVLKLEDTDGDNNIFRLFPDEPSCDFSDGLAMINGGEYYIDKEGNRIVIENACGMYKNGLVVIRDPETNLMGYADINGNVVIPCKYIWARDFLPCGVALVFTPDYYETVIDAYHQDMRFCGYVNKKGEEIIPLEFYTPYYVGSSGLYPMPHEQNGIIDVYKEGFNYYYRYDGTLLGKKPRMKEIGYRDELYDINLAEYWQWVNDGKPVG